MYEKVNPYHPDKVADRIAGAIIDEAYTQAEGGFAKSNPRIAAEVQVGHGSATVIIETNLSRSELNARSVSGIVRHFLPNVLPDVFIVPQDEHLSDNQRNGLRVGDNGIFKGCPVTDEQKTLLAIAKELTEQHPSDGKYIIDGSRVIICQSNLSDEQAVKMAEWLGSNGLIPTINPLGEWTGGVNVDTGAVNRKLGSDMGDGVTGGGLHGKDLSKADVSVNILCHMKAQASGEVVMACTAIGDESVTFRYESGREETLPFFEVVEQARMYILTQHGSFEHFAEWGLIA